MYNDLAIFLKVVELGTYVAAAKRLNTTQSTITRRIQALEEQLGTILFKRNYRGLIELTSSGQLLFNNIYPYYKKFDNTLTNFTEAGAIRGTLRVALPATISRSVISPYIPEFAALYPEITLLIDYTSKPIDMMKDNYDIAISSLLPLSQNSKVKLLHRSQFKLYAKHEYVQKYGAPATLQELAEHRFIGLLTETGEPVTNYTVKHIATDTRLTQSLQAKIYVNHAFQAIEMAINGNLITGMWDDMAVNLLKNKVIIPILAEYSFGEQSYYLIREHHIYNKLEQLFAAFLESKFNQLSQPKE